MFYIDLKRQMIHCSFSETKKQQFSEHLTVTRRCGARKDRLFNGATVFITGTKADVKEN